MVDRESNDYLPAVGDELDDDVIEKVMLFEDLLKSTKIGHVRLPVSSTFALLERIIGDCTAFPFFDAEVDLRIECETDIARTIVLVLTTVTKNARQDIDKRSPKYCSYLTP